MIEEKLKQIADEISRLPHEQEKILENFITELICMNTGYEILDIYEKILKITRNKTW